jgi:hypothetical protein
VHDQGRLAADPNGFDTGTGVLGPGVAVPGGHEGGRRRQEGDFGHPLVPEPGQVAGDLAGARGEPHQGDVTEVESLEKDVQAGLPVKKVHAVGSKADPHTHLLKPWSGFR